MPYRCERVGLMRRKIALIVAVALVGVAAGLGAAALSALIHGVEILAFGQGESAALRIVTDGTTPLRRLLALMGGGALVTLGWWWLQTRGRPVVSVEAAVVAETSAAARPPFPEGVIHALLQIVAVGIGAPVGREVAPRELGALFAGRIADALKIDDEMRRVLVACGAAAGLAGVYHVPFAGAIFALVYGAQCEYRFGRFGYCHGGGADRGFARSVLCRRPGQRFDSFRAVGGCRGSAGGAACGRLWPCGQRS